MDSKAEFKGGCDLSKFISTDKMTRNHTVYPKEAVDSALERYSERLKDAVLNSLIEKEKLMASKMTFSADFNAQVSPGDVLYMGDKPLGVVTGSTFTTERSVSPVYELGNTSPLTYSYRISSNPCNELTLGSGSITASECHWDAYTQWQQDHIQLSPLKYTTFTTDSTGDWGRSPLLDTWKKSTGKVSVKESDLSKLESLHPYLKAFLEKALVMLDIMDGHKTWTPEQKEAAMALGWRPRNKDHYPDMGDFLK